jgi:hypothetical protein
MTKDALPFLTALLASQLIAQTANPHPAASPHSVLDAQSGPVLGKPVSGTELRHFTQTLSDGTHVENSDKSRFYRDADGRTRVENSGIAMILDPVAHVTYNIDLVKKTYRRTANNEKAQMLTIAVSGNQTSGSAGSSYTHSTTHSTSSEQSSQPMHTHGQISTSMEELAPQMLNGVNVKGSRVTHVIPAGSFGNDRDVKVVTERWFSHDLKLLIKSSTNDPRTGVTTYEFSDIGQGPSDPSLFQVPAGFLELVDAKKTR